MKAKEYNDQKDCDNKTERKILDQKEIMKKDCQHIRTGHPRKAREQNVRNIVKITTWSQTSNQK